MVLPLSVQVPKDFYPERTVVLVHRPTIPQRVCPVRLDSPSANHWIPVMPAHQASSEAWCSSDIQEKTTLRGGDTLLRGALPDQSALHGVLAQIEALGLELLELRRLPGGPAASL
jgi:hypothetical protein